MQNQNGQTPQGPAPVMGQENAAPATGGLMQGAKGMFDSIKGPVFWVALGYVACKFLDRKRVVKI